MKGNFKIGERNLDFVVLYILQTHPNIDTAQLKDYIWEYVDPDGVNVVPLVDRNDTVIDQIVRNIISHRKDSTNNIIFRGLVDYNHGILSITKKGLTELDKYVKDEPFR